MTLVAMTAFVNGHAAVLVDSDGLPVGTATNPLMVNTTDLKSKYLLAKDSTVHMKQSSATGLAPLTTADVLATAGARYTALRARILLHYADAPASATVDHAHLVADTANGAGMGTDVSSLANQITRVDEMKTSLIAHATQSGVHFHADSGVLAALTLTTDPPTTQAHVNTDLNDITTALDLHFALASF